jgi:hypothetical protein
LGQFTESFFERIRRHPRIEPRQCMPQAVFKHDLAVILALATEPRSAISAVLHLPAQL